MDEIIIQLYKCRQLMHIDRVLCKIICAIEDGNAAALRHPLRKIVTVLGKDAACTAIRLYDCRNVAEDALALDGFLILLV